jgi:putative ABC transport system permease protein
LKPQALLLTALASLLAHPGRSALTILGIVIGVASVIAVVAIGSGSRQLVEERLQSIGANLLLVLPDSDKASQGQTPAILSSADAEAIRSEIPGLVAVAPSVYQRERVIHGSGNRLTTVQGIDNDYLVAREWAVARGRAFSKRELAHSPKVVLLGTTVQQELFGSSDPLDRIVRIGDIPFTVVGTMTAKGLSSVGSDQDDKVLVPLGTAQKFLDGSRDARRGRLNYIMLKVDRQSRLDATAVAIRDLLQQRHRKPSWEETDFEVRNLSDVQETRKEASAVFGRSLVAVALISLVVGGISVMNIMLVSVSERTHEIGLRMALGARQADIHNQFLLEALVLTVLAGLLGVAVGVAASHLVAQVAGWPVLIRPEAVAAGLACALGVGVVFGLYPARRAARLDPIEALRFE